APARAWLTADKSSLAAHLLAFKSTCDPCKLAGSAPIEAVSVVARVLKPLNDGGGRTSPPPIPLYKVFPGVQTWGDLIYPLASRDASPDWGHPPGRERRACKSRGPPERAVSAPSPAVPFFQPRPFGETQASRSDHQWSGCGCYGRSEASPPTKSDQG